MVEKASKLKITVLRRFAPDEVFKDPPVDIGGLEVCDVYEDGQEFIVEGNGAMPEGFCGWAWDDIYKDIQTLRFHGDFQWIKESGISINCCTDGLRPVVFKIERI